MGEFFIYLLFFKANIHNEGVFIDLIFFKGNIHNGEVFF